ncbi:MAG: Sporulation related domain, partial [Candidatus Aminicenantes bacterium]|nr:Sporulation related domain [Candidatus Aminicenantes bacterium]
LGVSVGKKQVRLTAPTQIVTQPIAEPVKEQPVKPSPADTESAAVAPVSGEPAPKSAPPAATVKAPVEKAPVETKKTAPPPVTAATGLYYVQVGAFTERAQAQAAADRYKKQGYTAVVANPKLTDTKNWYRVRLGGYASRDRAVDLLAKLNAAAGKKTDFRVVQD